VYVSVLIEQICSVGLTGVVDARCTGVELVVDGQVYKHDVLYRPIGYSGIAVTCQNCDDNINRPTWHMPNGALVPPCNISDGAVCFNWTNTRSRDLVYLNYEELLGGRYECGINGGLPKSVNITVLGGWVDDIIHLLCYT